MPVTALHHFTIRCAPHEVRAHLHAQGVAFAEAPIPGWAIHQLFLHDPRGLKIEMTFWMDQEDRQGGEGGAA